MSPRTRPTGFSLSEHISDTHATLSLIPIGLVSIYFDIPKQNCSSIYSSNLRKTSAFCVKTLNFYENIFYMYFCRKVCSTLWTVIFLFHHYRHNDVYFLWRDVIINLRKFSSSNAEPHTKFTNCTVNSLKMASQLMFLLITTITSVRKHFYVCSLICFIIKFLWEGKMNNYCNFT